MTIRTKRDVQVEDALSVVKASMSNLVKRYELTPAEQIQLVTEFSSGWIATIARDFVAEERKKNPPMYRPTPPPFRPPSKIIEVRDEEKKR